MTLPILTARMETMPMFTRDTVRSMVRLLSNLSTASLPNLVSLVETRHDACCRMYADFHSSESRDSFLFPPGSTVGDESAIGVALRTGDSSDVDGANVDRHVWVSGSLEGSGKKLPFWYMPKFIRGKSSWLLSELSFLSVFIKVQIRPSSTTRRLCQGLRSSDLHSKGHFMNAPG